jgi:[ribosomal protein S18]-alanine N-acetyltransferase
MLVITVGTRQELEAVASIESLSFGAGASHAGRWTKESFEQDLQLSWSRLVIARLGEEIVAFCNYWVVADEIQILNVATHPTYRRQGVAQQLLVHIIEEAMQQKLASLTLEVRKGNDPAQALYQKLGFIKVGERSKYYSDNQEAAVLMTLTLR